eukprot:g8847.t1
MTQHMGFMDLSDDEEEDGEPVVGYVEVLSPATLGWQFKEIKDGETTVGRTDDQDVTIADPSVSGSHAAIDVVELPGEGGKRLTLKDLRSTNGTYIVDVATGDKTRLAPRKVTVLPEEGCRVHFGGVVCKVAMGLVPDPPADNEEAAAAEAGVYDNDTQLPGAIDDVDNDAVGEGGSGGPGAASDSATGDKESGTEPLANIQEGEEKTARGEEGKGEARGGGSEAAHGKQETERGAPEANELGAASSSDGERQDQGVEETKGEGGAGGRSDGKGPSPSRVRFEGVEPLSRGEGGGGGAGTEDDEAGAEEPPTQGMALELDESEDDAERDQGGGSGAGASAGMALEIEDGGSDQGQEGKSGGAAENQSRAGVGAGAGGSADKALELDDSGSDDEIDGEGDVTAAKRADPAAAAACAGEAATRRGDAGAGGSAGMALELDASSSEDEKDGKGAGAALAEQTDAAEGGGPSNPPGASAATPADPAPSDKTAGPANSGEDTADEGDAALLFQKLDEESDGQKDKSAPAAVGDDHRRGDGDDTADEGDTALLFDDQDEEMAKAVADAGAGSSASAAAASSPGPTASMGPTTTPMTPSTVPDAPGGQVTSPGNVSDVSTQRQEGSPRVATRVGEGAGQGPAATAPVERGSAPETSGAGGAAAAAEAASGSQGAGAGEVSVGGKRGTNSVDGDEGSDSSGALIPAQDLKGFEDDLLTAPDITEHDGDDAGAVGAGDGGSGPPVEDDSGSETDATEVDTDDGPPVEREPKPAEKKAAATTAKPTSSAGGGQPAGTMAPPSTTSAGAENRQPMTSAGNVDAGNCGGGGDGGGSGGASANASREKPSTPEETRSPGGSLLRRTSTEDAMMAIAREHARNEAANIARAGAGALARDSEEEEEEEGGPGDTEVDNFGLEADTQAVPIQHEEEDEDEENAADGTEVVEEGDSPPQQVDDAACAAASPPNTGAGSREDVASPGSGAAAASGAAVVHETAAGTAEPEGKAPNEGDVTERVAEAGASVVAEAKVTSEWPPSEAGGGEDAEGPMGRNEEGTAGTGGGVDADEKVEQAGSVEREGEKGEKESKDEEDKGEEGEKKEKGEKEQEEEEEEEEECGTNGKEQQIREDNESARGENPREKRGGRAAKTAAAAAATAAFAAAPAATRTSGRQKKATAKAISEDADHTHAQDSTNQRGGAAEKQGEHPPTPPAAVARKPSKRARGRPAEGAAAKSEEETSPARIPARASGRGKAASRSSPLPISVDAGGRSASVGGGDGENPDGVKVCFTGVKPTNKERSCMKKLGVSEVDSVLEATHLVAGGSGVPLKRTPKLLAGLGHCRFVVDVEWLYQSAKEGKLLDGVEFVLCDAEAEKKWAFNMRLSLGRRPEAGLLAGLSVHVDPAVAGAKGMGCPPADEMKMVVTSAGGQWLPQIPKRGGPDPESLLVISHPDALKAAGAKGVKSRAAAAAGRNGSAYLPEMLFLCILRQRMSWPADLAIDGGGDTAEKEKPAKRRRA